MSINTGPIERDKIIDHLLSGMMRTRHEAVLSKFQAQTSSEHFEAGRLAGQADTYLEILPMVALLVDTDAP